MTLINLERVGGCPQQGAADVSSAEFFPLPSAGKMPAALWVRRLRSKACSIGATRLSWQPLTHGKRRSARSTLGKEQPSGGQDRQTKRIDRLIIEPRCRNREPGRDEIADEPINHDSSEDVGRKVAKAAIQEQFAPLGRRQRFSDQPVKPWRTQRQRCVSPVCERPRPAVPHRRVLPGTRRKIGASLNSVASIAASTRPREGDRREVEGRSDDTTDADSLHPEASRATK